MISKAQQEIIDVLTEQFVNLNSTPTVQGNLIDIGTLLASKVEGERRIEEIKAINDSMKKLRQEIAEGIARDLQPDLVKLSIKPEIKSGYINVVSADKHVCHTKEFSIDVELSTTYEHIGGKSRTIYGKPCFRVCGNAVRYETLEDLVEGKTFKKCLENLFNEIHF